MPNKELVKNKFQKSLATYQKNAVVQKQMADSLLQNLIENKGANFPKIFEIGCGEGLLTRKIRASLNFQKLFLNDLIESAEPNFLIGDCEKIEFPKLLDLVISNATFQWVEDFPSLCSKIFSALNSQGIFAFTSFGEQNFKQIKSITGNSLNYFEQNEIEKILSKNFTIIYSNSEIVNLEFNSTCEVLNHLKLCGVNALEQTKWTKRDLNDFGDKYNDFIAKDGKFILTYHPMSFIAQKRS